MRWQKTARLGIAVFIVVFAGFVFLALRKSGSAPTRAERLKIDDKAVVQTLGVAEWKRVDKAGKVLFSIKSQNQKVFEDGRNVFLDATLTLPDRDGRTITITSNEAETTRPADGSTDFATALLRGNVKLRTSDDLIVTCNDASYSDKEGFLQVPGPVTFTRGRMTGKGNGATYDRPRDVLWILADAQISVVPDATGGGGLQATSGTAGLARADHYIRLSKAAHVVADNRTIDADDLTATLTPDDQKVQGMQLRGNSRIVGTGAGAQSMSAKDIDLTYAPDGRTLQQSKLMEESVVQLPSEGSGPRRIAARMIDMTMSPDGATVTLLNAIDSVVLDLPAQGPAPAKTIKASSLVAAGEGGAGLQTATFEGPVDYREVRAAQGDLAAVDRHGTARRLIVHTKPGLGDLQQAEFRGNFKFVDGSQTAEAPIGLYQVDQDRLDLAPSTTEPGPPPTVTDSQLTVHARTISMTMGTERLRAETDVRSIMERKPDAGRGAQGKTQEQPKLPSLLKQDQPVTIRSNRLEYDGAASHALYSGSARLTQPGGTELQADTIELDDKSGNLAAHVKVRTKMLLDDVDPKTKQRTSTETIGTSDDFLYEDAKRLATYTSTGTVLAHLVGPTGDLTGNRIDLFLKQGANELERLEADGTVTTVESNRTARGRHLTYTAADETYVMVGSPVEVVQKEVNATSCKKTLAGSLRFQRAVDSIQTEGSPVTTTNIACPGTRD
jgi:lipopolysaccharide export system protein LptA